MILVHRRDVSVAPVMALVAQAVNPPLSVAFRRDLNTAVERTAESIKQQRNANATLRQLTLNYLDAEELLAYSGRMTDHYILELPDHFRCYDLDGLPFYTGAAWADGYRASTTITKRRSGDVTGAFAEAMCPWVFERCGISRASTFNRLAGLAPTVWGNTLPDFLFWMGATEVPCESKHYARHIRWDGVATAITQVCAGMECMSVGEGWLFLALANPSPQLRANGIRYEAEVIRLHG